MHQNRPAKKDTHSIHYEKVSNYPRHVLPCNCVAHHGFPNQLSEQCIIVRRGHIQYILLMSLSIKEVELAFF